MRAFAALAALGLAGLALAGCPKAQAPTPGELARQLSEQAPSYASLHKLAATGHAAPSLHVRETALADLELGSSPAQAKARYGDPRRRRHTPEGDWWEYDEVLHAADATDTPPSREQVGTLRLLFKPMPEAVPRARPDRAATAAAAPPPFVLVQIQAWAPGKQETRSLVRLLDPVARVERKYGAPPRKLNVGTSGGEVWVYPASDVAFVVSPPEPPTPEVDGPATAPGRIVAATIVGL